MCGELASLADRHYSVVLAAVLCVLSVWLYRHTNNRLDDKSSATKHPFEYPTIDPCTQGLPQTKPTPYRPFRWGAYHVTMGIQSMKWNEWIELDQEFEKYYRIRYYRIQTYREKVVKTLHGQPGIVSSGYPAAREVVHELAEYLIRRYPHVYSVTRRPASTAVEVGWYAEGKIQTITLDAVGGKTIDLDREDPMTAAALLVQDDLAVLVEGSDGRYYLQAGAIVMPGSWRLEDKAGMPLDEIHESGRVPLYREKLHFGLGKFMKRLPVEKPVVRYNYTFQVVDPATNRPDGEKLVDRDELAWSSTMLGDEFPDGQVTRDGKRGIVNVVTPEMIVLRTERQTLRRLPKTGAILFTIRTYTTPVTKLVRELGVPGRLASAVRSWPEVVARYKDRDAFGEVLLSYLDECANEQAAAGNFCTGEKDYPL